MGSPRYQRTARNRSNTDAQRGQGLASGGPTENRREMMGAMMTALQAKVESLTRQVEQLAPENERVRKLLTEFDDRHDRDQAEIEHLRKAVKGDRGICRDCMGSGESGPDMVCHTCNGDGADHANTRTPAPTEGDPQ